MSLQDKRNALFGSGGGSSSTTASSSSKPAPYKPPLKTSIPAPTAGLPEPVRLKKIAEGAALHQKALEHLKTTMFKWAPDHLMAAPVFEKAAMCYSVAGDYNTSMDLYKLAAKSHESCSSEGAAATSLSRAAEVASSSGNATLSADLYSQAGELWGIRGDVNKRSECLVKAAAKLLEKSMTNDESAGFCEGYYLTALDLLCPPGQALSKSLPPFLLEAVREYFDFLIKRKELKKALPFARKAIDIFEIMGSEHSMCKMMTCVTILQLNEGDVVGADKTYVQEWLGKSVYMRSTECVLAEELIMAFKSMDEDKLNDAVKSQRLTFIDKGVADIARAFKFTVKKKEKKEKVDPPRPPAPAPIDLSDELDALDFSDPTLESAEDETPPPASASVPAPTYYAPKEEEEDDEEGDDDEIDLC